MAMVLESSLLDELEEALGGTTFPVDGTELREIEARARSNVTVSEKTEIPLPLREPEASWYCKYPIPPTAVQPLIPDEDQRVHLPMILEPRLKPHQREGIAFLFKRLHQQNSGAVLAHSMGLGKTCQTVAALHLMFQYGCINRVLILSPKSTLSAWNEQIETWSYGLSHIPVLTCDGANSRDNDHRIMRWKEGILLMSPELFAGPYIGSRREHIQNVADVVIVDEAHRIHSKKSEFHNALNGFRTPKRLCLTGWPLQNNLVEYLVMLEFACPHLMRNHKELHAKLMTINPDAMSLTALDELLEEFYAIVDPIVHRRNASLLKHMIPPLHEHVVYVNPSGPQAHLLQKLSTAHEEKLELFKLAVLSARLSAHPDVLYYGAQHHRAARIATGAEDIESTDSEDTKILPWDKIFATMNYVPRQRDASSKMCALLSILHAASQLKEKTLVFSQSLGTLDIVQWFLDHQAPWCHGYVRIDGGCNHNSRTQAIADFQNPLSNVTVVLISARAGGLGITLTAGTRVVLMDVSWNPCDDGQAIHRAYRIGQTKPVHVYRLILARSVESRLFNLQRNKMFLFFTVVDHARKNRGAMVSKKTRIDKKWLKDEGQYDAEGNSFVDLDLQARIAALNAVDNGVLQRIYENKCANMRSVEAGHDSAQFDATAPKRVSSGKQEEET